MTVDDGRQLNFRGKLSRKPAALPGLGLCISPLEDRVSFSAKRRRLSIDARPAPERDAARRRTPSAVCWRSGPTTACPSAGNGTGQLRRRTPSTKGKGGQHRTTGEAVTAFRAALEEFSTGARRALLGKGADEPLQRALGPWEIRARRSSAGGGSQRVPCRSAGAGLLTELTFWPVREIICMGCAWDVHAPCIPHAPPSLSLTERFPQLDGRGPMPPTG